jgi:hypothetical protein
LEGVSSNRREMSNSRTGLLVASTLPASSTDRKTSVWTPAVVTTAAAPCVHAPPSIRYSVYATPEYVSEDSNDIVAEFA